MDTGVVAGGHFGIGIVGNVGGHGSYKARVWNGELKIVKHYSFIVTPLMEPK